MGSEMRPKYKSALRVAGEEAFQSEVVDTLMVEHVIGEGKDYRSKSEWIEHRVSNWLEEASREG